MFKELDTVIKFHASENFQVFRQKKSIEKEYVGLPIVPKNILLPFQLEHASSTPLNTTLELYNVNDNLIQTLFTGSVGDFYRRYDTKRKIFIFEYFGNVEFSTHMPLGVFYIKYSDSIITHRYSDLFRVCDFIEPISSNKTMINDYDFTLINTLDKTLI